MGVFNTFHEGLARKELLLPWCKSCRRYHFYPRFACPHCWESEYEWRPAAGTGAIHSFTVVRANPPSAFAELLPYAIAIVDLDEGVRLLTRLVGDFGSVNIGHKVRIEFGEHGGQNVPLFRALA